MKTCFTLLLSLIFTASFSQTCQLTGKITDDKDGSPMTGVTVSVRNTSNGTQTDLDGNYKLELKPGIHTIDLSYVSYTKQSITVSVAPSDVAKKMDATMSLESTDLDIVVVTGSKYEKKLGEEVVSMEVLKANVILQNNAKMDEALNKVPGVNMLGRSISIRGGSGFSDATGNRVLGLLDEMPLISPENGSIRWEAMPIEALEQVEVIKGSSSALYGSSALNGVLNMRTINPKPEAVNKLLLNFGVYDQPRQRTWNWWWYKKSMNAKGDTIDRLQPRMFGGGQFVHAKQYGQIGVVVAGAYLQDIGFRFNNDFKRARMLAKLRYIPKKFEKITVGLNMTFFHETAKDFFAGSGLAKNMYIPSQAALTSQRNITVDPYITYYDEKDNRFSAKFRYYHVGFNSSTGDSSLSSQFFYDLSYMKTFRKINLNITAGSNGFYTYTKGRTFGDLVADIYSSSLFQPRKVWTFSAYMQVEKKFFNKLTLTGGLRIDVAQLDKAIVLNKLPFINLLNQSHKKGKYIKSPVTPLFRFGLNYQATEGTYLRASFGQGFRYPALSEKYVYTVRSGAQVFPNDSLLPENGWSAEIGIKQGVKISKWVAYFDITGFIMQYQDMIEFQINTNLPDSVGGQPLTVYGVPFKAYNVDNTRIMGFEASAVASGSIFGVPLNFLIGYSFLDPKNLSYDSANPMSTKILKYRSRHSAKADIQANYKGATLGLAALYVSHMIEIDKGQLGALKWVNDFRTAHNKGFFTLDIRAGYTWKEKFLFNFIVKNILNTEYMLRPALIEAPRSYTFQVGYNF
ncbi:MAG: TonB-dependent receptor [Bacteroidetes bacterium]|nr:TonB-dependent receptor [Bacteroidota bacterium]